MSEVDSAARHRRARGPVGRGDARPGSSMLDALVYRSNLLGADRALANQGGGNTSAKGTVVDHAGRETRVLWVKGSGTDLATIAPAGFAALRLDEMLPLRERDGDGRRGDGRLPAPLRRSAPTSRGPSIETLLHAFIPAAHVDHTHPDAIIALTSSPDGRRLAEETFGDEAVWLDYQRPGFDMSRRIAELLDAQPVGARGPAREARARHVGRHGAGRATATRSSSSRAPRKRSTAPASGRFGLGGRRPRSSGTRTRVRPPRAIPSRAPRRSARRRRRRRARGRPEPGSRRVRIVGARA